MWIPPHGLNRLLDVIRLYYEIEPVFILVDVRTTGLFSDWRHRLLEILQVNRAVASEDLPGRLLQI